MRLIVRQDAEANIAAAYDWYEEQRHGLGREFLEEVSAVIETVRTQPLRFPAIFRTLRRALVHRFPYGIFYVFRADTITVVAAMHLAGHPDAFIAGPSRTSNKCFERTRSKQRTAQAWGWAAMAIALCTMSISSCEEIAP